MVTRARRRTRYCVASLNLESGTPIYRQLMEQISHMIVSAQLQAGDSLPSVRELAEQYAVNPMSRTFYMPSGERWKEVTDNRRIYDFTLLQNYDSSASWRGS